MRKTGSIAILGVFMADTSYRAARLPQIGETLPGKSFALGPGGKGSNQAVAAARAGGNVSFLTRLGDDAFADIAFSVWREAGVHPVINPDPDSYTGAAFIFVDDSTGDNAIIISPGAAARIAPVDIWAWAPQIDNADVFVTQLEQPVDAARSGLARARRAGVTTILNTAPATDLSDEMLSLCDYVTPNETEAGQLTGIAVDSFDSARRAGDALLKRGVGAALITLGERGALLHTSEMSEHIPAFNAGPVVETTGAGDALNGGFAVALAEGQSPLDAARFGSATAALSVTRPGTAPSMPKRQEIEAVLVG